MAPVFGTELGIKVGVAASLGIGLGRELDLSPVLGIELETGPEAESGIEAIQGSISSLVTVPTTGVAILGLELCGRDSRHSETL